LQHCFVVLFDQLLPDCAATVEGHPAEFGAHDFGEFAFLDGWMPSRDAAKVTDRGPGVCGGRRRRFAGVYIKS
jgi:hypothetical protein